MGMIGAQFSSDKYYCNLDLLQAKARFSSVTDDILRLQFQPDGTPPSPSWSILPELQDTASLSLAQTNTHEDLLLSTATLNVHIHYQDDNHQPTLSIVHTNGTPMVTTGAALGFSQNSHGVRWQTLFHPQALVYGGGLRTGSLDRRGRTLTCWNQDPLPHHDEHTDNMYQCIPFLIMVLHNHTYGIYFDTSWRALLDIGANDPASLAVQTTAPDLTLYLFAGPTLADVLKQYTTITGRMPMPPRWSLGYQQSRWSYASAQELSITGNLMREHCLPCDALYLDIDYMDGYRDFTFDTQHFPDPPTLFHTLQAQGFQIIPLIDPALKVDQHYQPYLTGLDHQYFVRDPHTNQPFEGWVWPGKSVWPDFLRAEVRKWWGNCHHDLLTLGASGIWNDMNEPTQTDMFAPVQGSIPHGSSLPTDIEAGSPQHPIPHIAWHNAYGTLMTQASYEAQQQFQPQKRPFVLTRAAGAGAQRYTAVWNGDNSSLWSHLALAITANLSMGLSGFPFTGSDIGGFWKDTTPELLVRFTQLGAFLPFFRNHSARHTLPQEPWQFGEPYTSLCRSAIEWRYRLLPYWYTLFYQASITGAPVMRPLTWAFPYDQKCRECNDQFMIGDALLVAPVIEQGATSRTIVLPPGEWFHMQTGILYGSLHTSSTLTLPVTLETLPLFVRAGTMLPVAEVVQHTAMTYQQSLTIQTYLTPHTPRAHLFLWDDDDHPQAIARESFSIHQGHANWHEQHVTVAIERQQGKFPLRYPGIQAQLILPSSPETRQVYQTQEAYGDKNIYRFIFSPLP